MLWYILTLPWFTYTLPMSTPAILIWHGARKTPLIARFVGPAWGPSGADRTQVGPMLAPWTLLSGTTYLVLRAKQCGDCCDFSAEDSYEFPEPFLAAHWHRPYKHAIMCQNRTGISPMLNALGWFWPYSGTWWQADGKLFLLPQIACHL